ncbi:hypothetical protein [Achromobacter animicus]|uniref:hypothetical protein n=1 Tax=Achromobacter animicus TaxID=1389935 RepID=UPI0028AC1863|nr:hypothetical protein [Achromobacter animicus]
MTTSYSDKILQALAQRGRLNCRQLAGAISHDFKKTTQLVGFMRTNKKIKTSGLVDGLAAYELTEAGRALLPNESLNGPETASPPRSIDDLADAQLRPARSAATNTQRPVQSPPAQHSQPEPAVDRSKPSTRPPMPTVRFEATKFGMLSTGEFLILIGERAITIRAADVPVMRAQLNATPAGVAK